MKKLLIANRGEIASRIIKSATQQGWKTVALYSKHDGSSPHIRQADEAFLLEGESLADTYLNIEQIISIADKTGATAIHPGYGFLSEKAAFAEACAKADIKFVGPSADAISKMGDKAGAKLLMEQANVPVLKGYHGADQTPAMLKEQASSIGYPLLIKASAGGGGKGMRLVEGAAEFEAALEAAKREAASAFGDDTVLLEKFLRKPRHVELQIFADQQGNTLYLSDRDCSIQRRHQKVVEEAPAPNLSDELRQQMGEAAVAAAKSVNYVGAGTIEFLLDEDGQFYFMEMNTRLQVEHPVTEEVTGIDLVAWQLDVVEGKELPISQDQVTITGHSVEVRLYAEDPSRDFLPQIGTVEALQWPEAKRLRIEAALEAGNEISPHFDPMIAKIISYAPDRSQASLMLASGLRQLVLEGVVTNKDFLAAILESSPFLEADLSTHFLEKHKQHNFAQTPNIAVEIWGSAALALLHPNLQGEGMLSPWEDAKGWRFGKSAYVEEWLQSGTQKVLARLIYKEDGWDVSIWDVKGEVLGKAKLRQLSEDVIQTEQGTAKLQLLNKSQAIVHLAGRATFIKVLDVDPMAHAEEEDEHSLVAPMPGRVLAVHIEKGATVAAGQTLLTLEAMKMEHTITAPHEGQIDDILYQVGDQVTEGAQLISFAEATS